MKLQHKDDLYVSLAKGHLDIEEVRKALKKKSENKFVKYWKLQFFKSDKDKPVPDKEKEEEKGKVINDIIVMLLILSLLRAVTLSRVTMLLA